MTALHGLIHDELRPQIARLVTGQKALDSRMGEVEAWRGGIEGSLMEFKNAMGESMTILIDKLNKLAEKVGAEK